MHGVIALSQSRFLRFFAFSALYFAQGVPWGFVATGYQVFLSDAGLNNEQVGSAVALAYLPWSFKVLAGPLLDALPIARWGFGRRRPYIVLAELLMGGTLFWLSLIGDLKTHIGLMQWVLLAHNACAALQDVAVDALAVDVLEADERSRANGFMWAAKVAGIAVGGGAGTYFAKLMGYSGLMLAMALIVWLVMLVPLCVREHSADAERAERARRKLPSLSELKHSFSFAAPFVGVAIAFFGPFGFALIPGFMTRMLHVEYHYTEEMIGTLNGVVEPISGAIGALLGGYAADRLSAKRGLALGSLGMGAMLVLFGATSAWWASFAYVIAWNAVYNLFNYTYQSAALGFFMTLSNPAIGATHFALYMATTNLCYSATSKLGGYIADHAGYANAYFIAAVTQVAFIALLPLCNLAQAEQRFHAHAPAS